MYIKDVRPTVFGRVDCIKRLFPERGAGMNRLYYVNSGEMVFKSEQGERLMKEGYLYLIPHNSINTITTEYVDHTFFNFYTYPQISNENLIEINLSEHQILKSAFDALNLYVEKNPGKSIPAKDDPRRIFVGSLLADILFLIGEINEINVVNDELVNDAIEYIHENFNKDISVSDLAQKFHMEQNSFIKRFKKHADITPYQYIKRVRVNMAVSLVKANKYSLEEIAAMVKYSDASALSHAIKKVLK